MKGGWDWVLRALFRAFKVTDFVKKRKTIMHLAARVSWDWKGKNEWFWLFYLWLVAAGMDKKTERSGSLKYWKTKRVKLHLCEVVEHLFCMLGAKIASLVTTDNVAGFPVTCQLVYPCADSISFRDCMPFPGGDLVLPVGEVVESLRSSRSQGTLWDAV